MADPPLPTIYAVLIDHRPAVERRFEPLLVTDDFEQAELMRGWNLHRNPKIYELRPIE